MTMAGAIAERAQARPMLSAGSSAIPARTLSRRGSFASRAGAQELAIALVLVGGSSSAALPSLTIASRRATAGRASAGAAGPPRVATGYLLSKLIEHPISEALELGANLDNVCETQKSSSSAK